MMRVPLVGLQRQHQSLSHEIQRLLPPFFEQSQFILGEELAHFEAEFASYLGCPHAVGVGSGLAALELSLRAFGIGPGDEVLAPANSFVATALAISAVGARPVLIDVEPETYNMSPAALSAAIGPRARAVIPVHLYGQPADLGALLAIARKHHLLVIEDAAQAHGALYKGRRTGTFGHAAAFSFYPTKNLGACGDGGMVVTADPVIADRVRQLRDYGRSTKDRHALLGTNSRLDNLQAALLRLKLRLLDNWNARRQAVAATYGELLKGLPVQLPNAVEDTLHVYHLFVIQLRDRDSVRESLQTQGIETGIHYPVPIHLQEAFSYLGYRRGNFPVTEAAAAHILSLPIYPELTEPEVRYVSEALKRSCLETPAS